MPVSDDLDHDVHGRRGHHRRLGARACRGRALHPERHHGDALAKWPLLIDPQGQGLGVDQAARRGQPLRVTELGDKRFRNHLEDAMAFGQPLLLENVEEVLDPILDPVLDKAIQRKGARLQGPARRQGVRVHGDVPLLPLTKLGNPHFSPELCAQVTVINFTVTMAGLEQQLSAASC